MSLVSLAAPCSADAAPSAVAPQGTASSVTWTRNVTTLSPNNWVTVTMPLDGKKRKVLLKCGADEGDACSRVDLRINGRVVLKTQTGELGLVSAIHRVLRFPGNKGLIAVSVEQYSTDDANNWNQEATYVGKLYKYAKGKLVMVRNLWNDHRKLATVSDPAYHNSDGRLATRSFISNVSAAGDRFTVTWHTVDWSCTNVDPSITYKYAKGAVSVVSHTSVEPCA
jgi:hypothetical protein